MALQWMMSLFRVSVFTAPIILILLLVAKLSYKKYSANTRLGLWIVTGFIMLFPIGTENLFTKISHFFFRQPLFETDYSMVADAFAEIEKAVTTGAVPSAETATRININPYRIVAISYFIIAVLCISYHIIQHLFYVKKIHRWSNKVTNLETLSTLEALKTKLGIKRSIAVISSESVSSPLLVGLFKPTIVLPKVESSTEIAPSILLHELMHDKRKDLWVQLLFLILQSLYWINPLVYWMRRQATEEIELACDTQVVNGLTQKEKKDYCYAILSFVNTESHSLTTGFSSKNGTKKRMESILNQKNKRKGILVILLVFILTTCLGACMYGNEKLEETGGPRIDPMEDLAELIEIQAATQQEIGEVYADAYEQEGKYIEHTTEIPDITLGWPVPNYYTIESPYGWRLDGLNFHTGIDISGEGIDGAPVVAATDGKVLVVNKEFAPGMGYGMYLIMEHEKGVSTLYGHLSAIDVQVGQEIKKGEQIGAVGSTGFSTGPHLQFETRVNGTHVNPQVFYPEESK